VIEGHTRLRLFEEITIQVFSLELRTEIEGEITVHKFAAISVIAIESMQLAVSIVHGGVEGAGDYEGAKSWNRLRETKLMGNFLGCL
jgi:hypothetical protein